MATVLYAGGRSYADAPDKNDSIPFIYQPGFDIPLVAGCAGWLVCKVMPYPDIQQQHNLFLGDIVAPGAMTGYSVTDTGFLMMRRTSYGPFTMSQAGSSMPSAKAASSIMDRVRTDLPRSCSSMMRCLRSRAADTPAPDAGRLAILTFEAAVEGLLGVKAEGDRHVEDRLGCCGLSVQPTFAAFAPEYILRGAARYVL